MIKAGSERFTPLGWLLLRYVDVEPDAQEVTPDPA